MTYAVIDTGGALIFHQAEVDLDAEVGPEGWDRVRLDPSTGAAAFVNDVGLLFPEKYPRNVVGACVLAALGANPHPYAGPVVITGWDPAAAYEIVTLPEARLVEAVHRDVTAALARTPGPDLEELAVAHTEWASRMRVFAAFVADAPTPGLTVHRPTKEH